MGPRHFFRMGVVATFGVEQGELCWNACPHDPVTRQWPHLARLVLCIHTIDLLFLKIATRNSTRAFVMSPIAKLEMPCSLDVLHLVDERFVIDDY